MPTPLLPLIQTAIDVAVPFQLEDAAFVARHKRVVVGHKTGLGKTFISLLAWSQWSDVRRVLIVGTSAAMNTWRRVLRQWGGAEVFPMKGISDPDWKLLLNKRQSGIWTCTYATFRLLMADTPGKVPIDLFITDELHKALRNRTTTWKAMMRVDSTYYIGATATWASKGPQDLYPVLHYIDKSLFPSYWRFVETWCHVADASYGKEIFGVRNADKLKALLHSRYYRTRTWKEVGSQFLHRSLEEEPVIRRSEIIPMSSEQLAIYNGMVNAKEARWDKDFILAQNSLDQLTKSLQLALSPQLLFPTAPVGGPVEWLTSKLLELDSAVVFLPFKPLASICGKFLKANGYERPMYNLYGGVTPDDCDATITAWRKTKGVVFCTISYAQSFPLDETDYAYMLGFDWDPNNNIQAEGRLRRFDSNFTCPCLVTYIVPEDSEYYKVREVINGKVSNVKQVLAGYGL